MRHIHKYKNTLLEEFYLGEDDLTIYRAKDGYHGRFKKGDVAKTYQSGNLKNFYDMVHIPKTRKSIKVAYLLCLLRNIPLPKNPVIDHINGDTTDNRRENLRIVNQQINNCNRCKRSDNTSGITGIRWSKSHQHYIIRKTVKGKRLSRSRKTLQEAKQVLKELHNMDRTYTKRHGK